MPRSRLRFPGQEITLPEGVLTIGRSDECAVTIDDPLASRQHATITVVGARATVRDLGSRNGTFVNGERLDGERLMKNGDEIAFGSRKAVFVAVSPALMRVDTQQELATVERPTPLSDVDRHRWWIDMHLDFVDKALGSNPETALEGFDRLVAGVGARIDPDDPPLAHSQLDKLCLVTVRVALATADAARIQWLFDLFTRVDLLPSAGALRASMCQAPQHFVAASLAIDACRAHWSSRRLQVGAERAAALDALDELAHSIALRRASAEDDPDTVTQSKRD